MMFGLNIDLWRINCYNISNLGKAYDKDRKT